MYVKYIPPKTNMDPRHKKRLKLIDNLFSLSFSGEEKKRKMPNEDPTTEKVVKNLKDIDAQISEHAPKYPVDKIAKIDLAILRLAMYELMIEKENPTRVIINEAVELAKELGTEKSYAFVNAVLGSYVKTAIDGGNEN